MDLIFWVTMALVIWFGLSEAKPAIKDWWARRAFRKELDSLDDFPVDSEDNNGHL